MIAQRKFLDDIIESENQFIECIGLGRVADRLFSKISLYNERIICIKLIVSKEICKKRLINRTWDIPFPEPLEKVDLLINNTEERFHQGKIELLWGQIATIFEIDYQNI